MHCYWAVLSTNYLAGDSWTTVTGFCTKCTLQNLFLKVFYCLLPKSYYPHISAVISNLVSGAVFTMASVSTLHWWQDIQLFLFSLWILEEYYQFFCWNAFELPVCRWTFWCCVFNYMAQLYWIGVRHMLIAFCLGLTGSLYFVQLCRDFVVNIRTKMTVNWRTLCPINSDPLLYVTLACYQLILKHSP